MRPWTAATWTPSSRQRGSGGSITATRPEWTCWWIGQSTGARRAVHLIFVREKVRSDYLVPVPGFAPAAVFRSRLLVAPVADLVTMKLTSFRLKDRVHIQDLDAAGLITADIEEQLPELLRQRLREVRASE